MRGRCCSYWAAALAAVIFFAGTRAEAGWQRKPLSEEHNIGSFCSIALESSNVAHFAFYDTTDSDLKYAKYDNGVWYTLTIDASGTVGQGTAIALDASKRPHICYYDGTNGNLKYATYASGMWQTSVIESAGTVGRFPSMAFNAAGNPCVAYYDVTNGNLKYAEWTGVAWSTQTVDGSANDVGVNPSLAVDSAGVKHISYWDNTAGDLKYSSSTASGWAVSTIVSAGTVGSYSAVAISTSGMPCIGFYDVSSADLRYVEYLGASGWVAQTIDSPGDVGQYVSMKITPAGYPRISYYDNTNGALKFAAWSGTSWSTKTVDNTGVVGYYTALALDSDGLARIACYDGASLQYYIQGTLPDFPLNFTGSVASATSMQWAWCERDDEAWYNLRNSNDNSVAVEKIAANSAGYLQTGLSANALKDYVLEAVNSYGSQVSTYSIRCCTPANAPTATAVSAVEGNTVALGWNANSNPVGTTYVVEYAVNPAFSTYGQVSTFTTAVVIRQLANNSTYYMRVYALNAAGQSTAYDSPVVAVTQTGLTVTIPSLVDTTNVVGEYSSIALDANNLPRISYYDNTSGNLKYAAWNGSAWAVEVVDSDNNVGKGTSLVLDAAGNPHISYVDVTSGLLRYAWWNGSWWHTETVDSGISTSAGPTSLRLTAQGNPCIAYYDSYGGDLKFASWNGTLWQVETVDYDGTTGINPSLALDASGHPHIAYTSLLSNYDLKYAEWTGAAWAISVIDSNGDVGYYPSLELDNDGLAHISYYDHTVGRLKYASLTSSGWQKQDVDNGSVVGLYTSLALDAQNNPHISYYDSANADLKYAQWVSGRWSTMTVVSANDVGKWSSLALDTFGRAHISYFNDTYDQLEYAVVGSTAGADAGSVNYVFNRMSVNLAIPAGAFSGPVSIAVTTPHSLPSASRSPSLHLVPTNMAVEITVNTGEQPALPVTLTFAYSDADIAGLEESALIVTWYDTSRRCWVPLPSSVDAVNNTITVAVSHFSLFQIMQSGLAENLDSVIAYPNPLRPSRGSGYDRMTFANLPATAEISIFTVNGEKVCQLPQPDATGRALWDGLASDGSKAASGVYIILLENEGSQRRFKIAVER